MKKGKGNGYLRLMKNYRFDRLVKSTSANNRLTHEKRYNKATATDRFSMWLDLPCARCGVKFTQPAEFDAWDATDYMDGMRIGVIICWYCALKAGVPCLSDVALITPEKWEGEAP